MLGRHTSCVGDLGCTFLSTRHQQPAIWVRRRQAKLTARQTTLPFMGVEIIVASMQSVFQSSLVSWQIDSVQSHPQISCTGALVRQMPLGCPQVMVVVRGRPCSRNHSLDAKRRRCWNSPGVFLRCRTGRADRPHCWDRLQSRSLGATAKNIGLYTGWPAFTLCRDIRARLVGGMSPAPT